MGKYEDTDSTSIHQKELSVAELTDIKNQINLLFGKDANAKRELNIVEEKTVQQPMIYIVQGRSGLVFGATTNYNVAKKLYDDIGRCRITQWLNGKCLIEGNYNGEE